MAINPDDIIVGTIGEYTRLDGSTKEWIIKEVNLNHVFFVGSSDPYHIVNFRASGWKLVRRGDDIAEKLVKEIFNPTNTISDLFGLDDPVELKRYKRKIY